MIKTKFTPGPWGTYLNSMEDIVIRKMSDDGDELQCIARHVSYKNAHLIAAAPDLYEALADMLSGWKYIRETHGDLYGVGWDRAQQKAETAISKARGESC